MLISDKLRDIWRNTQDQIISDAAHEATVYYPITVSGTGSDNIDNLFEESLDPNDPLNSIDSGNQTQTNSQIITGIFREDLYGAGINTGEATQLSTAGRFEPEDCMFTCSISDSLRNANAVQFHTYFHGCDYVTISGLPDEFEVKRVGRRGLKDPYTIDVIMRRRNE